MTNQITQLQPSDDSRFPSEESLSGPNNLEFIATEKLKPNNRNARTHSKKQIQQIADSIQKFGFTNPILVDESYGVIAGHGRLQAAQKLVEVSLLIAHHGFRQD